MASRITTCTKCESTNITDVNPELKKTTKSHTVKITAKCNNCQHIFEYNSATSFGHRTGVRY